MIRKNKVLIIGPFPNPISGVSIANFNLKRILVNNEFQVYTINTSFKVFDERLGVFSFNKLFFYLFLNLKLYKIFLVNQVYITPGQTFFGLLKYSLFIVFSKLLKKELIIHVHGNHLNSEFKSLSFGKKRIFKYLISKFNKGIVLSSSLIKNLSPFIPRDKIFIVPNFAEDYIYKNINNEIDDKKGINIFYLSNLMKEKGIFEFINAIKLLEKENYEFKVKIAGNIDSQLIDEIKLQLSNLKSVKYLGVVYGKEKRDLLNWGNIFVLPTYYKMEGQPISILEAMATNNVIITTKHAGIPDIIIHKKHGFFVKKKNAIDLKNKLAYLIENKVLINQISCANKSYFLNNFTMSVFEKNIIKVFLKEYI